MTDTAPGFDRHMLEALVCPLTQAPLPTTTAGGCCGGLQRNHRQPTFLQLPGGIALGLGHQIAVQGGAVAVDGLKAVTGHAFRPPSRASLHPLK